MAKSKRQRRARPPRPSPGLDAEARVRAARREDVRRRFGWPMVIIGVALFLFGQLGSRAGLPGLPFDRHHVISQVAGFLLAIAGLSWTWR